MQACNASVARQWHGKISPMRALEYVRGSHSPTRTPSRTSAAVASGWSRPSSIRDSGTARFSNDRRSHRTRERHSSTHSDRNRFYGLPVHAITLARRECLGTRKKDCLSGISASKSAAFNLAVTSRAWSGNDSCGLGTCNTEVARADTHSCTCTLFLPPCRTCSCRRAAVRAAVPCPSFPRYYVAEALLPRQPRRRAAAPADFVGVARCGATAVASGRSAQLIFGCRPIAIDDDNRCTIGALHSLTVVQGNRLSHRGWNPDPQQHHPPFQMPAYHW